MLVVMIATVDASAAGTCRPAVVNAGAGMAAVAIDAEDGTCCSCQCQGWGLLQSSMLELGAGHDRQRWGWGLSRLSTQEVSMASVVVDAGDRDSTVIRNTRLLSGKKRTHLPGQSY